MGKNETLLYYEQNAVKYSNDTVDVSFVEVQDRFLSYLKPGAYILDFGCGSGRDTRFFLGKGYKVDAIDGSTKLCDMASQLTGIPVRNMLFSELDDIEKYDGIWACSSILHLPKDELKDVLNKMLRALKSGGFVYTSFKYGDFEGYRNQRYFTYFTEDTFRFFLNEISGIKIIETWISSDVRPGRNEEKWLNLILKKE